MQITKMADGSYAGAGTLTTAAIEALFPEAASLRPGDTLTINASVERARVRELTGKALHLHPRTQTEDYYAAIERGDLPVYLSTRVERGKRIFQLRMVRSTAPTERDWVVAEFFRNAAGKFELATCGGINGEPRLNTVGGRVTVQHNR